MKFHDYITIGIMGLIPLGIWTAMSADDMVYNVFCLGVGLVFVSTLIVFCERLDSGKDIVFKRNKTILS